MGQAAATSVGLGMPNMPVALIPGHPGSQSLQELRANVRNVTAAHVIENLLQQPTDHHQDWRGEADRRVTRHEGDQHGA